MLTRLPRQSIVHVDSRGRTWMRYGGGWVGERRGGWGSRPIIGRAVPPGPYLHLQDTRHDEAHSGQRAAQPITHRFHEASIRRQTPTRGSSLPPIRRRVPVFKDGDALAEKQSPPVTCHLCEETRHNPTQTTDSNERGDEHANRYYEFVKSTPPPTPRSPWLFAGCG